MKDERMGLVSAEEKGMKGIEGAAYGYLSDCWRQNSNCRATARLRSKALDLWCCSVCFS